MIFISVPPWSNTISVMPVRYSFSSGPMISAGSPSTSVVKLAMSVNIEVMSRHCALQVDVLGIGGQQVHQTRRKIPGKLRARPFRLLLAPLIAAGDLQVAQRLARSWFPDRRNRSAWSGSRTRRGSSRCGCWPCRHKPRRSPWPGWPSRSCKRPSSVSPSIRGMLMSHSTMSMSGLVIQHRQRVHAIVGEGEAELAFANLPAEALDDQQFQVRLVIDD